MSTAQADAILERRARDLARAAVISPAEAGEQIRVVSFRLAAELYCIEIAYLLETALLTELAKVPGAPSCIVGISNLRGQLFPVADLKRLFSMPDKGLTAETKIIILHASGNILGVLTDGIAGNSVQPLSGFMPLPVTLQLPGTEFIRGITSTGLMLLDGEKLLNFEKMVSK